MDDRETLNRRARLRELIDQCFDGKLVGLMLHVRGRCGVEPNQGELSALRKDNSSKSFGDKKAKVLTEQIGLHRRWFDWPPGVHLARQEWELPYDGAIHRLTAQEPVPAFGGLAPSPFNASSPADASKRLVRELVAFMASLDPLVAPSARDVIRRVLDGELQDYQAVDSLTRLQAMSATASPSKRTGTG